jgi:hypothetical protein
MDIILSPGLWENVWGGVIAAMLYALIVAVLNLYKQFVLQVLIQIMGRAIRHRNNGEQGKFDDEELWVRQAKEIEKDAMVTARKLSATAGSLIEWLDRIPERNDSSVLQKYISILDVVIARIRGLMEKYA